MKGLYVVRVNDVPACYKSGHFPRKFAYKKDAVNAAKEAVAAGASMARVEFPDMGELDFYPSDTKAKVKDQMTSLIREEKKKKQERSQAIDRLKEIKDKVTGLLCETEKLVRDHASRLTYERAKTYWIAHAFMAITNDHDYVGSCSPNLEKTIEEMEKEI